VHATVRVLSAELPESGELLRAGAAVGRGAVLRLLLSGGRAVLTLGDTFDAPGSCRRARPSLAPRGRFDRKKSSSSGGTLNRHKRRRAWALKYIAMERRTRPVFAQINGSGSTRRRSSAAMLPLANRPSRIVNWNVNPERRPKCAAPRRGERIAVFVRQGGSGRGGWGGGGGDSG